MAYLPKIEKENSTKGEKGTTQKKSKSIPTSLMAPNPKENAIKKDNIILFPSERIVNKKPTFNREDCCERTVTLLKEISKSSSIDDDGKKKQAGGREKVSETNKILKEMSKTLSSMLDIQAMQFQGSLESDREKKPGLGGIVEKVNQDAKSLMQLIGEGLLIAAALSFGPIVKAIEGLIDFLKGFGDGSDTQKGLAESGTGLESIGAPDGKLEFRRGATLFSPEETREEFEARRTKTPLEAINAEYHARRRAEKNGSAVTSRDAVNPYGSAVKALIAKGESSNDVKGRGYNSANKPNAGDGKPNEAIVVEGLKDKTIKEVQKMQADGEIFTAGKYHIIPTTLKDAVKALKLTGDEKFDEKMQEKIYDNYLTGIKPGRENINAFKQGKSNDVDAAALDLAKEFASVPDPKTGRSFYDKDGFNKSSITVDEIKAALIADQKSGKQQINLDKINNDAIQMAAASNNKKQQPNTPSVTNNTTVNQTSGNKSPSINVFPTIDADMSDVIRRAGQF